MWWTDNVPVEALAQGGLQDSPSRAILHSTSGGEASRSKHFTQTLYHFNFIMSFQFQSSAIENISDVQDEQVTITFNGGRDYTYKVADPANFVSDLQLVIDNEDSVGKFINLSIRERVLENVTV